MILSWRNGATIFIALLSFGSVLAGPRVGNGGGVWVCRDRASKDLRWLKLVDFFEAVNEFGLVLEEPKRLDAWQILDEKLKFIRKQVPGLSKKILQTPEQLKEVTRILPTGSELTVIHDIYVRVYPSPESCEQGYLFYGQLANYTFDGRLLISGEFWYSDLFSEQERGGLLVHELIYKALRDSEEDKDKYSSRARHIVAILFSELGMQSKKLMIEEVLSQPAPR